VWPTEAMITAATSNPRVLKFPEPLVIFSDFGDNSLVFELYFWVLMKTVLEKKQIKSQVRFEIHSLFSKGNLVIAFPQMDIHFDGKKPVIVQLVNPNGKPRDLP
jgi:potassium efflux system protein